MIKQSISLTSTTDAVPQNSDQNLCLICGLCCDGTLFHSVAADADKDAETLATLGANTTMIMGGLVMLLPCVAHIEGACTIYAIRPHACRAFHCKLLQKFDQGIISWEQAKTTVDEAKQHRARMGQQPAPGASDRHEGKANDIYREFADGGADENN